VIKDMVGAGAVSKIMIFAALISLGLAIFNLLPIPALDGGRLLSVYIQTLFRLPPEKYYMVE
jgi:regulator of sigma E protease